ncbi:MAG: dihydroneopterin aldolase [Deltaproteobacteria bacterium]|nr:dihydroneopterin aldolase [Deltaproteobacteria bacterium]
MQTDTIRIEGIEFYGYHGDLPEERELGQRYIVDIEMVRDCAEAGRSDRIEETIDYAAVAKRIDEIGRTERFHLVEALAERIAQIILEEFAPEKVQVNVTKPHPPIPLSIQKVGVTIRRTRS